VAYNDGELLGLSFERGRISEHLDQTLARWKQAINQPGTQALSQTLNPKL
jgi:hypothetical protein